MTHESTSNGPEHAPRWLHRFAIFLAGLTVFLIFAGGHVKSREAGLSVPDWPLSYGEWMPDGWFRMHNVRAEHGHRMIAGTVGLLTFLLTALLHWFEPRRWVRRLGLVACGTVIVQALLGGLTVIYLLPKPISIAHAGLAQIFLVIMTSIAVVTSARFAKAGPRLEASSRLPNWAIGLTGAIYAQIIFGAMLRHIESGWALALHLLGVFAVGGLLLGLGFRLLSSTEEERAWLQRPTMILFVLFGLQMALGGLSLFNTMKGLGLERPNMIWFPEIWSTLHVMTGALFLQTSVVLTWRAFRLRKEHRESPHREVVAG